MKKEPAKNGIACSHCGEDSGWTTEDLAPIRGDHDLKCQQKSCGKIAIRHRAGAPPSIMPEPKIKHEIPWGQRGVVKYKKKNADDTIF